MSNLPDRKRNRWAAALPTAAGLILLLFLTASLPEPYAGAALGFGAAALYSGMLYTQPDVFRSRKGSLKPALGLAAFLWLAPTLTTLLAWLEGAL